MKQKNCSVSSQYMYIMLIKGFYIGQTHDLSLTINLWWMGLTPHFFYAIFQRERTFVTFFLFPMGMKPFWKGFIYKGKNLLQQEQILPLWVDPYIKKQKWTLLYLEVNLFALSLPLLPYLFALGLIRKNWSREN